MKFFISRYSRPRLEENPLWLIVLSDIMTNLMLFFLVLYVFNLRPEQDVQASFVEGFKRKTVSDEKEKRAQDIIQKFKEKDIAQTISSELKKTGLEEISQMQMTDKYIKINIAAPILFQSGKSELGQNAQSILNAMGKLLSKLDNDIIVEGHTDNVPIRSGDYTTNWELSAARANTVVDYFKDVFNIPPERVISAAYGEYRPVDSNDTPEGRAKNRRIEIVVIRK